MHVFGLWEEAGLPGQNLHRHRKNLNMVSETSHGPLIISWRFAFDTVSNMEQQPLVVVIVVFSHFFVFA